jgi:hypothetical protein
MLNGLTCTLVSVVSQDFFEAKSDEGDQRSISTPNFHPGIAAMDM